MPDLDPSPLSSPSRAFLDLWDAARRRETFTLAGVTYSPRPDKEALHARVRALLLAEVGFMSFLPAFTPQGADLCAARITADVLNLYPWHPLEGPGE